MSTYGLKVKTMKTSTILFLLLLLINSPNLYSQEQRPSFKIYSRQRGVGYESIEFLTDDKFIRNGRAGLAISIIDKGQYEIMDDTLFLTFTEPRVINYVDTFTNPGHYTFRKDTLFRIDSLSFCKKKDCLNFDYKIVEERFDNGNLKRTYQWTSQPGVISNVNGAQHFWDILIPDGIWFEYHPNGRVKHTTEYKEGQKNGWELEIDSEGQLVMKGQWQNSKRVGDWIHFDKYRNFLK